MRFQKGKKEFSAGKILFSEKNNQLCADWPPNICIYIITLGADAVPLKKDFRGVHCCLLRRAAWKVCFLDPQLSQSPSVP
jgi:hypothetical protein